MSKVYRIGEAAKLLGVKTSALRFWEEEFSQIRPKRTDKGQRYYSEKDMQILRHIHELLHVEGMTISGVQKALKRNDKILIAHKQNTSEREALQNIKIHSNQSQTEQLRTEQLQAQNIHTSQFDTLTQNPTLPTSEIVDDAQQNFTTPPHTTFLSLADADFTSTSALSMSGLLAPSFPSPHISQFSLLSSQVTSYKTDEDIVQETAKPTFFPDYPHADAMPTPKDLSYEYISKQYDGAFPDCEKCEENSYLTSQNAKLEEENKAVLTQIEKLKIVHKQEEITLKKAHTATLLEIKAELENLLELLPATASVSTQTPHVTNITSTNSEHQG